MVLEGVAVFSISLLNLCIFSVTRSHEGGVLLLPGSSDSASFGRFAIEAEREGTSIFTNQHDARQGRDHRLVTYHSRASLQYPSWAKDCF